MKAVVRRCLCIRVVGLQSSNLLTYHKESDIVSISISLRSLVKLVNDAFSEPINSQTAFLCKKLNAYFHLKTLQIMSLKTKFSNSFNPSKHFLFFQNVFSVTIFHLPRCLQDVFQKCLQDEFQSYFGKQEVFAWIETSK